jgi:threonyl-tRNA synthetase
MIHRAPFGSLERFIALLIEHTAGKFPLWLNPEQFIILPLSEHYNDYAKEVLKLLKNYDIRGLIDERAEKVGRKIRDAELNKIPYMLIVGEKEAKEKVLSVRKQGSGDIGTFTVNEFKEIISKNISESLMNFDELS